MKRKEPEPKLEDILKIHEGGKVRLESRVTIDSIEQLRHVYTPGVAQVCKLIEREPERVYEYTSISNTIAIVTNGTAVLGLGDIGPRPSMPVMEGKSCILDQMGGVACVPILVDSHVAAEVVETVEKIAATFAGILLEEISAPACFEIEDELKARLDIPVFHDDQHGTAVVTLAALISALKLAGKNAEDCTVAMNGAGAAGSAVAGFLLSYGIKDVVLCDSAGAIYEGRTENMNAAKERIARATNNEHQQGPPADVMKGKDIFIGVSVAGVVSQDMVRSMADDPIVFAMANPTPEIWPHEAMDAGAVASSDGRTINNALGFPGLFRGTLDARASEISEEMKFAAARALAELAPEGELVPDFMDREVHRAVAAAVARAARESGVARL